MIHYYVPNWVSIAFLIAIPLPFILILNFIRIESKKLNNSIIFPISLVFFIFYILYVYLASYLGWFNQILFPPKVLLITTVPFAFLLFMVVAKTQKFQTILENTNLENLVKLHIFRVIGVFFIILAFYDALPKPFALIAGCGDMIAAITSLFVAKAIQNKNPNAKKLTYIWNVFGFIDILFTAIAANALTKISIDTGSMGVDTLATWPFCIIPAFAPPMIMFLHWTIFKKLKKFS
ncbi:MAG: hypothetical protein O9267_09810 [Flavobacterium sp.]|uniref:hypothetical protein n=1 Tax=Flavobacterium sp. TaxID=239 RepID=UPI0022CA9530|nr:hypothetical protein [Flavobacterium sp.]MCZ8197889.1 hypothetical protein [Flavobacterium sp.]